MMAAEVILFCSARVSLLIDAMARRKRGTKIASNNLQRSPPLQRPTPRAQKGAFDTSRGRPSKMAPLSCNFLHQNTLGDGRINKYEYGINQFGALIAYWVGLHPHHPYLPCSNHQGGTDRLSPSFPTHPMYYIYIYISSFKNHP